MPGSGQRFFGALASIGITIGGAWLASQFSSPVPVKASTRTPSADSSLVVKVEGARNQNGKIVVMVFDDETTYRNHDVSKAVGYRQVVVKWPTEVSFPRLKTGPYAISIFHDENANRDFDYDGTTPEEGFASSGPTDPYATPTFAKAATGPGTVSIEFNYID